MHPAHGRDVAEHCSAYSNVPAPKVPDVVRDRSHAIRHEPRRQVFNSSAVGSAEGETPERFPGPDDMQFLQTNIMTTPAANQPCESGRHPWDSLRRNEEPQLASKMRNRMRAEAARALGATPTRRAERAQLPVDRWRPGATWRQPSRSRQGRGACGGCYSNRAYLF